MKRAPAQVLPAERRGAMRRGRLLALGMIAYLVADVVVLYLIMGGSQSVLNLVVADLLELVAPIAYLVSSSLATEPPSSRYPYGHHRVVALGSLGSALALVAFGLVLLGLSARTLLTGTHPTIGSVGLFGVEVWQGWLVLAYAVPGAGVPVLLGRAMMPRARTINNRPLYYAARMLAADWQTTLAGMVGVAGIALGIWWLDATAAIVISLMVVADGYTNMRRAAAGLMNRMPTEIGSDEIVELVSRIEGLAEAEDWTGDVEVRLREEGEAYFGEVLVGLHQPQADLRRLEDLERRIEDLDWRLQNIVVVPLRLERE